MNAYVNPLAGGDAIVAQTRIEDYIWNRSFDRPTLVIDRQVVAQQYRALKAGLGRADIHYAVKANPAYGVIETLIAEGSHFDAASRGEIELCLSMGAEAHTISFGNTIKRPADIAWAFAAGITLFAADSEAELEKIAANAPGAEVYIRLLVGATGADWPLSRKFGCAPEKALALLDMAQSLGLQPVGLSFHVGSQPRRAEMWRDTLDQVAAVWAQAQGAGHALSLINIGGGFPAFYGEAIEGPTDYAAQVMAMVEPRFPGASRIMAEPGRGMVAEAGMIAAEVLLVSKKPDDELCRWVYLYIGRFQAWPKPRARPFATNSSPGATTKIPAPASWQAPHVTAQTCCTKIAPCNCPWGWPRASASSSAAAAPIHRAIHRWASTAFHRWMLW